MKYFFLDKLLRFGAGRLDGYKTTIGGIGLILSGLVGLLGHLFPEQGLPQMELETAFTTMAGGFVALGLGGKAEKLKVAVETAKGK